MPNYGAGRKSAAGGAAPGARKLVPAPIERVVPKFEGLYEEFARKQAAGVIKIRTNEHASRRYEDRASFKRMGFAVLIAFVPLVGVFVVNGIGKWGSERVSARDKQLQGMQASANATAFANVTPIALGGSGGEGSGLPSIQVVGTPTPTVRQAIPGSVPYTPQQFWEAFGGKGPVPTAFVIPASP